jgi:hypothetical protein
MIVADDGVVNLKRKNGKLLAGASRHSLQMRLKPVALGRP